MAYPIITDIFRVQVVMQAPSGLPEDQFVNNWYFRNDDNPLINPDTLAGYMKSVLDAFYDQQNGSATSTVASWLTNFQSVVYKVYDLVEATPRYPITDPLDASWTGGASGSVLPREVACCLSYQSGNGPRRRGRLYIGPLRNTTVTIQDNHPVPEDDFELALMESAVNVLNTSENVTWMQVSPTAGAAWEVTGGWVDNAFDTQRSRGKSPSSRRRYDSSGVDV